MRAVCELQDSRTGGCSVALIEGDVWEQGGARPLEPPAPRQQTPLVTKQKNPQTITSASRCWRGRAGAQLPAVGPDQAFSPEGPFPLLSLLLHIPLMRWIGARGCVDTPASPARLRLSPAPRCHSDWGGVRTLPAARALCSLWAARGGTV